MLTDLELRPLGRDLAEWLRGQRFGEIHVVEAVSDVIVDVEGYTAIDLAVVVDDPHGETWPLDDVLTLEQAVRDRAEERQALPLIYVHLRPRTPLRQEEDGPVA